MITIPSSSSHTQLLQSNSNLPVPAKQDKDGDQAGPTASAVQVTLGQQRSQSSSVIYSPPASVKPVDSPASDNNTASSTILTFIDAQLRRDLAEGASAEQLASRLQAGLDGFMGGFNEAYEQLKASGFLTDEVSAAITSTYDQVLAGIDALAAELDVPSPVVFESVPEPAEQASIARAVTINEEAINEQNSKPLNTLSTIADDRLASVDRQKLDLIDSLPDVFTPSVSKDADSQSTLLAQERRYQFDLVTAQGDRVSISAFSHYSSSASYSSGAGAQSVSQGQSLGFSVDGDINEDELAAINELLAQVNELADDFFDGDLGAAFDRALELNIDREQIAQFSLSLAQSQTVSVASVYQDVERLGQDEQPVGLAKNEIISLAKAYQQTQILTLISDNIHIEYTMLEQLSTFVSDLRNDKAAGDTNDNSGFQPFLKKMLV